MSEESLLPTICSTCLYFGQFFSKVNGVCQGKQSPVAGINFCNHWEQADDSRVGEFLTYKYKEKGDDIF